MDSAAPSTETASTTIAPVAPGSLTHGDWQEALGLEDDDLFESQAALLAVEGDDDANELDVMGSLLAEYNADDAAAPVTIRIQFCGDLYGN